jgi:amino-acid N-acetyltransferase
MNIHSAERADLPAVRALLETERLPASDLDEQALDRFLVLRDESGVSGVVGLELYGDVAFLRSLVVAPQERGNGTGSALTQAAEALAVKLGVVNIYLLTLTAERFFAARGYTKIDRGDAPKAIRGTTQFSGLCPSSAVFMMKHLC